MDQRRHRGVVGQWFLAAGVMVVWFCAVPGILKAEVGAEEIAAVESETVDPYEVRRAG